MICVITYMNITLLLEDFCHHAYYMKGHSSKTIKRYREQITYFSKTSKIDRIEQISTDIIKSFFLFGRTNKKWKATTYHTYYMSLRSFFAWCLEHKYIQQDYLEGIELPPIKKSLPKGIKKQNALKILEIIYNYPYTQDFVRYRNHAIFSMFLFAGLRKNELLNLKLTDVDVDNLTIFVRFGKGAKDRIIPMSFTLAQSLKRYLEKRKKQGKTCPEFFVCSNRDRGFTESGLKSFLDGFRKATNIHFTIHQLRHTFATLMLEGGCDIYSLSGMMGHSDIKTTTIYLSATPEHLRCQMAKHPLNRF